MIEINALGKPCPIPVIEAKKAIRGLKGQSGEIKVLVDNDVASKNIEKMAKGMGFNVTSEPNSEAQIEVTIEVTDKATASGEEHEKEVVVAFGKKTMGDGDPKLGEMLLKTFVYSLTELDTPPEHLLFFNEGAYLTGKSSDILKDLKTLHDKGTQISTCGTCLDFYDIKANLAIGEITNMYGIVEVMTQGKKVITV